MAACALHCQRKSFSVAYKQLPDMADNTRNPQQLRIRVGNSCANWGCSLCSTKKTIVVAIRPKLMAVDDPKIKAIKTANGRKVLCTEWVYLANLSPGQISMSRGSRNELS